MAELKTLNKKQIIDICYGATFLGSGGGGPFKTGNTLIGTLKIKQGKSNLYDAVQTLVNNVFRNLPEDVEVTVKTVEEVDDHVGLTAVVAFIGSPNAMLQLDNVDPVIAAFEKLNDQLKLKNQRIGYVIPVELGALNSIVPILVAAQKEIPVINADGAGRAVPSLTTTTFGAADLSANPTILAKSEKKGISVFVETAAEAESFVRPVLEFFDEQAGLAMWAMDKETLQRAVPIRGTLQLAQEVGELFNHTAIFPEQSVEYIIHAIVQKLNEYGWQAAPVFAGIVQPPEQKTQGGFDYGTVILRNEENQQEAWIYNQNENLIAWNPQKSAPIITAPDSICYLYIDRDLNGSVLRVLPFSNADIIPLGIVGKMAILIGIVAHEEWQSNLKLRNSFMKILADLGFRVPYKPFPEW